MIFYNRLRSIFHWLVHRKEEEQALDTDVQSFIDLSAVEKIQSGIPPDEARRLALLEIGGAEQTKEQVRAQRHGALLDEIGQDLRYALRMLLKYRCFTAIAILTLALGIGANTAIFSILDAALLRPLPFPDSDRLVRIWSTKDDKSLGGPSPMDMRDFSAASRSFEGMVVYDHWRKNVSGIAGSNDPEEMVVGLVPGKYFELLRIRPLMGRLFRDEESVYGRHYVAAISSTLWRSRFAADPHILERTLRINGETYPIVAVLPDITPKWMDQTNAPIAIWTPYASATVWTEEARTARGDLTLGRLKPAVSNEQARAELMTLAAQLAREHREDEGIGVTVESLADTRAGPVRPVLLMLAGAVALVLLIACANLASLLVARNSARSRELAVRASLGAGRFRLLRQLLLETLVLSISGGLIGLVLASAAGVVLTRTNGTGNLPYTAASNALPQFWSTTLQPRVLLFTLGISIVTAVLFGLAPAFTASRVSLAETLREAGRSGTVGTGRQRFRRILVIAEVALCLVLVFAATLLVETMMHLRRQDLGFRSDHLLIAHIYVPPARYADSDAITGFCDVFAERVRSLPGVLDASVTTGYPPSITWQQMFTVPGLPIARLSDVPVTRFAAVDDHYIRTLGLPLRSGRDFVDTDISTSQPVAVVNEEFVRRYFSNQTAIGRQIHPGPPSGIPPVLLQDFGSSSRDITIVGVVPNFMNDGMALSPQPQMFTLFRQFPGLNYGFKDIVVRTASNPESIVPAVAQELKSLDPEIPLGEVQTMDNHINNQTADTRFTTVVMGLFAGLGTVLALIGIYGVVAYLVAQRAQEFGVRLALGATSTDVLWLVLRYGLLIGLVGVAFGLVGAMFVRQSLAGLLYGVEVSDPLTLIGTALLLLLVVVMASAVPAARAVRIDPVQALRGD